MVPTGSDEVKWLYGSVLVDCQPEGDFMLTPLSRGFILDQST